MDGSSVRGLVLSFLGALGGPIGCTASTLGYGELGAGVEAETGIDLDSEGSESGEDDDAPSGDGDGDAGLEACVDVEFDEPVSIEMDSNDPLDPCVELTFEGLVETSEIGIYGLMACDCDAPEPECDGEKFQLFLELPDPTWMPALELDSCQQIALYSETVAPGVCRRSRLDITTAGESRPWYSVGTTHEDLDHAGLSFNPTEADRCVDGCGEWSLRDLQVSLDSIEGAEVTLGWGESAVMDDAEVIHWRSWVSPAGCGEPSQDRSAWTLKAP